MRRSAPKSVVVESLKPDGAEQRESVFSLGTLVAFRLLVTTVLLVASGYLGSREPEIGVAPRFFWFLGFAYSLNLLYLGMLSRLGRGTQVHVQIFGDLLTITGLVYFTGVASASFVLLYPIVVLLGSTLLNGGKRFAFAAIGLYGALLSAVRGQVVPPAGLNDFLGATDRFVFASIVFVAVPSFLAAQVGQYLSAAIQRTGEKLEDASGRAAELAELNKLIVEAIPSGLLLYDNDWRVTFVNTRGAEILGLRPEEIVTSDVRDLVPGRSLDGAGVSERDRQDASLVLRDGRVRILGVSTSRMNDDGHTLVVFRDLTEIRSLEAQVRATERLAAAGQLAAQMAHEIRNPLGAIAGASQILAARGGMAPEAQRLLDIISKESHRLSGTLQGFLSSARAASPTEPRLCDLGAIANEVLTLAKLSHERSANHKVRLQAQGEYWALVPASDAKQILWNVVRNGLEAMPEGGTLDVSLQRDSKSVSIEVADDGPGFQSILSGVSGLSSKPGGNGIGLAVVHRLIAENGGSVALASGVSGGGRVRMEFPVESRTA